ncbi:hypothetical protein G6553_05910 [Nocardioides sp. IC4_145]|nr:hypothetical protein [Nocardioides sp. IC4_145]
MAVLVLIAAFAVDLGMQRVARRDMQAVADVVAMDLSRELKGQSTGTILDSAAFKTAVAQSVARNDDNILGAAPTLLVEVGLVSATSFIPTGSLTHRAGDSAVGTVTKTTPGALPNAVRVTANGGVDFAFTSGRGDVSRTAVSTTQSYACFRVGSYALSVDPGNPNDPESKLINALLGDALNVTAIGYHGLADANISLAGIAAALNVGSPEGLAAVEGLTVRHLVEVSAAVLLREAGAVTADVSLLQSLQEKASVLLDATIDLDRVLTLTTASPAALATDINVLDLLAGAVLVANGENLLKTGVIWNEPAISKGEVLLQVIEAPRQGCGPIGTKVSTSQVKLHTTIELQPGSKLWNLDVVKVDGKVPLVVDVDVAKADATLTRIKCGAGSTADKQEVDVQVDRSNIRLGLSAPLHLSGTLGLGSLVNDLWSLLSRLGLGNLLTTLFSRAPQLRFDITVEAGASLDSGSTSSTAPFKHPDQQYGALVPVSPRDTLKLPAASVVIGDITGSVSLIVGGEDKGEVLLGELNLGGLISAITSEIVNKSVNPLINNVNAIINPLTSMLGITANGADVIVQAPPSCDVPRLVG